MIYDYYSYTNTFLTAVKISVSLKRKQTYDMRNGTHIDIDTHPYINSPINGSQRIQLKWVNGWANFHMSYLFWTGCNRYRSGDDRGNQKDPLSISIYIFHPHTLLIEKILRIQKHMIDSSQRLLLAAVAEEHAAEWQWARTNSIHIIFSA